MNRKQISGLIALIIGVILIIYALHSMNRISEAKSNINNAGSRISNSSFGKMVNGEMQKKASQYDEEVRICLISGIVLLLAGGGVIYYFRKQKRR